MKTFHQMIETTGVANGETFNSEQDLRRYLSVDNMINMFGYEQGSAVTQDTLDDLYDHLIYNSDDYDFLTFDDEDKPVVTHTWTSAPKEITP